jgi:ABC-type multidrug transport system ATPase subunit
MAQLHHIKICHFRGLEQFEQTFGKGITCIIGRGDSGKSTILDAISYVFCSSWSLHLNDSDFTGNDTSSPIIIEGTVVDVPLELVEKFGKHIRGVLADGVLIDDMESADAVSAQIALTIQLKVGKDLEPVWSVVSYHGEEPSIIKAADRGKLNVFSVSDYTDRHFSLNKGNPLYSLYKQLNDGAIPDDENKVLDVVREAKTAFDASINDKFDAVIKKLKEEASSLGITLNDMKAMLDHKDIAISENKVSIHENGIPFRLKGKGSKRLLSLAIQLSLTSPSGVILIDEIEQGLEPDRAQHLVNVLSRHFDKQVIITTHSSNVIVEIPCESLFIMRSNAKGLLHIEGELQGSIRKNPEAFFAEKVLVCEGATEVGICRAINKWRQDSGKVSATCKGVRFADGEGRHLDDYVVGFRNLSFTTGLFCDSDDDDINKQKQTFVAQGIELIDCESNNAIENQVFKDVSWATVKELIPIAIQKVMEDDGKSQEEAEESVFSSTNARLINKMASMDHWYDIENNELRIALGETAKKKEWYKRQSYGERLGQIVLMHYGELAEGCKLKNEIDAISNWIDA